ncbi:MAG: leucyl/phenylalanyl-tRNA--protein transferase [Ferruginibacter sp.]|nr:leucyl/phenylalanyl-tRNA--protein transferase [Ferruginibacter sp.]
MVFQLVDELVFPHPSLANEDGLLAIGADLSAERLILAYENGIFPWYDEPPVLWYAPHERCVIFPDKVHVSKSMNKLFKRPAFEIYMNSDFAAVINACSTVLRKDQQGTWINEEMKAAYIHLHHLGVAQSIEVWESGALIGGMYGLVINGVFCGESMFSKKSNASKAALIWLCKSGKFRLLDCQVPNDHLLSLGAEMIPQAEYLQLLQQK